MLATNSRIVILDGSFGSRMANEMQYEFTTVQVIRGTESRSIAKLEADGWELVDENQGKLRTTLNFRRPKPKVPWRAVAAGGGILMLAVVIGIGMVLGDGEDKTAKSSSGTSAATGAQSSEAPAVGKSETAEAKTDEPEGDRVMIAANNDDFATLLRVDDSCDGSIGQFAHKHAGKRIDFNGSIVDMANHGGYDTRYDVLVGPGGKGPETTTGPAFKFEDVSVFDLNLTGTNIPDTVGKGDRFRFLAEIGEFNPDQCLLFLKPVTTEVR